jgi:hypothetical protein
MNKMNWEKCRADCPYAERYTENTCICNFAGHMGYVKIGDTCVSPIKISHDELDCDDYIPF